MKKEMDKALEQYLLPSDRYPQSLIRSIRYSVFAGGKRLRPILVLASAEAVDGPVKQIVPFALGVELIHTYTLIHDDLPALDNDDLRRGKPTNHKTFGEATAILAGDALQTYAFQ
ncbi:MAG: polyprenyl synthetase family protein, partial [Nitrospinota bacterium]|nr:polyprenyl synthetase family protein [Nitrospinota bacterium]